MSLPPELLTLCGDWSGHNALYLPAEPVHRSAAAAEIDAPVLRSFLTIHYTWHLGSAPQAGLLLLSGDENGRALATWTDSWHYTNALMALDGTIDPAGANLSGSYAAGDGPDWGWRIELRPTAPDALEMLMFNVTPQGEEALAVEITLQRRPETAV